MRSRFTCRIVAVGIVVVGMCEARNVFAQPEVGGASGGAIFATYCAACHGTSAKGDGPLASTLGGAGFNRHLLHHWEPKISYTRFRELEGRRATALGWRECIELVAELTQWDVRLAGAGVPGLSDALRTLQRSLRKDFAAYIAREYPRSM